MIKHTFILLTLLATQGCQVEGTSTHDLESFINDISFQQRPEFMPLPDLRVIEQHEYTARHFPDPFDKKNLINQQAQVLYVDKLQPDLKRNKEPLEDYARKQLKLVGLIEIENKPWCVFSTPDAMVYRATIGGYLGKNYGKIKNILLDKQIVQITESTKKRNGQWARQVVSISMSE